MNYLEHHIVDHCNLNCKGCSHFSPLAPQWFESLNDFTKDFTQLASIMQVNIIRLMGGEPLLHPQVKDFLIIARKIFPKSEIQLVTNGILLQQDQELIKIVNENNITICVSNYNIIKNFKERTKNIKKLRVDNKSNMYNICLKEQQDQDLINNFSHCDLHYNHWNYFQNGKFYHCCIGANIHIFNEYFNKNLPIPDGISIYEHNSKEIEEYLNKPIPLCAFCNTLQRLKTYTNFTTSKKEIIEWIYH